MKTYYKILFFIGLMVTGPLAFGQVDSVFTQLVGVVTFSGFSAGGSYDVTGTLSSFSDQTNRYSANDIEKGAIVWDNQRQRWRVDSVISQNLLSAVVELTDLGNTGGTPFGVGFVTSETTTGGFSGFPPDNSTGISQQLKSAVETHNWLKLAAFLRDSISASGGGEAAKLIKPYDSGEGFWCYCEPGVVTTSGAAGLYTVAIPDSVDINHLYAQFTSAGTDFTAGGEVQITVQWAGAGGNFNQNFASAILPDVKIIDAAGQQREPADVSVTVSSTAPASGNTVTTIANINGVGTPVSVRLSY
jgi:hypothetical protein